jgi:hypothetical protein
MTCGSHLSSNAMSATSSKNAHNDPPFRLLPLKLLLSAAVVDAACRVLNGGDVKRGL